MPSFNVNGPKTITMETFRKYQQLRPENGAKNWSIETLFQYAIDENHPTDLRLLAWRDLLFQTGSIFAPEASDYCHRAQQQWYPNILHINSPKDGEALREAFRGRPRLVNEFATQLEYNLRHGLMHRDLVRYRIGYHDPTDPCDQLIEIVLPLVNDTMARKLWKHHTFYNFAQTPPTYAAALNYIKLCQPEVNMPRWLTGAIKTDIATLATSEIEHMRDHTDTKRIDYDNYDCTEKTPVISAIIYQLHHFDREKQANFITDYVSYLEHTLPENYLYFDFFELRQFAPIIQNDLTALCLLNRHIPPLQDDKFVSKYPHPYSKDDENFLMWVNGFAHLHQSLATNHNVEPLIHTTLDIHRKAKFSGQFHGY